MFTQSGGSNAAAFLSINNLSRYVLSGGTVQLSGGLENAGTMDGAGGTAVINLDNGIVDFSTGTFVNMKSASLTITSSNSLVIVPASGFDPSAAFGSFTNAGLTHTAGTTLVVAANHAIAGCGSIGDLVDCQGSITAGAGGPINLNGGLMLSGTGTINLGGGSLQCDNGVSTQTGGTNTIYTLYVGNSSGTSGGYSLSGNGQLSGSWQYVGYSGTGAFTHSAGTNAVVSNLYLGTHVGASGSYNLSNVGQLSGSKEYVGYQGNGVFLQSGGTNTVTGSLCLAYSAGSTGVYNLNGGLLLTSLLSPGSGTASFNFGGGTLGAAQSFSSTLPMTINAGGATVDTRGFNVVLSGILGGNGGLNKIGSGTLSLVNTNSYSGGTTVGGGVLALDFSQPTAPASNILNASSPLAMNGGTFWVQGRSAATNSQTVNGLTLNGASSIQVASGARRLGHAGARGPLRAMPTAPSISSCPPAAALPPPAARPTPC